jgi:2-polyprenyl-3-methyl-5-hydroxy-6-metoxy-1,4-benzoquinol methylase
VSSSQHVEIERSWTANADAWTTVVRDGLIPSRKAGTDAAIVAAVSALRTGPILDVGCGEGWLVRALAAEGIAGTGIDISAPLIASARALGGGTFDVVTYAQLEQDMSVVAGPWHGIVCNFALLAEPVHPLLAALRARLAAGGRLMIQTVHPWSARGDRPYQSEWRTETFDAFGTAFPSPMPWYYRTLADWQRELTTAGLRVLEMHEPLHPETGAPLSLLLTCEAW